MSLLTKVARELRPIVEEAIRRGCWELVDTRRRSAHPIRMVHTSGRFIALTKTKASGVRGIENVKADIRRVERENLTRST